MDETTPTTRQGEPAPICGSEDMPGLPEDRAVRRGASQRDTIRIVIDSTRHGIPSFTILDARLTSMQVVAPGWRFLREEGREVSPGLHPARLPADWQTQQERQDLTDALARHEAATRRVHKIEAALAEARAAVECMTQEVLDLVGKPEPREATP